MKTSPSIQSWNRFLRKEGWKFINGVMETHDVSDGVLRGRVSWLEAADPGDNRLIISTHFTVRQPKGAKPDYWERFSETRFTHMGEWVSEPEIRAGLIYFCSDFRPTNILYPNTDALAQKLRQL